MSHRLTRRSFVHLPAAGLVALLPSTLAAQPHRAWTRPRRLAPASGPGAGEGSRRRLAPRPRPRARTGRAAAGAGACGGRLGLRRLGNGARRRRAHRPARDRRVPAGQRRASRRCSRRPCSVSSTSCARWSRLGPGIQGTLGPHGITLLAHARTGGAGLRRGRARTWRAVGGADVRQRHPPLAPADRDAVVGRYTLRSGPARPLRRRRPQRISSASSGRAPTGGTSSTTPATWCSSRRRALGEDRLRARRPARSRASPSPTRRWW